MCIRDRADYCAGFTIIADQACIDAGTLRLEQVEDHYQARKDALDSVMEGATPYKPMPPETLYLTQDELAASLADLTQISGFISPATASRAVVDLGGRAGRNFAMERNAGGNVF